MGSYRTAFVTGASSGIGRAVSERLAAHGTHVVLAARRESLLQEVRAGIEAAGGRAEVCVLDVGDAPAVRSAVREADERLDGLELVWANAGTGAARHALKLDPEEVDRVVGVNVRGAVATLLAGLDAMKERDRGTLAATTSLAGVLPMPTSGAYSASKAFLTTFLSTLSIDLARTGMRVCELRPGFVETDMTAGNDFHMPFLWSLDRAADRCTASLEASRRVDAFPWPLYLPLRILRALPDPLWRAVAGRTRVARR